PRRAGGAYHDDGCATQADRLSLGNRRHRIEPTHCHGAGRVRSPCGGRERHEAVTAVTLFGLLKLIHVASVIWMFGVLLGAFTRSVPLLARPSSGFRALSPIS